MPATTPIDRDTIRRLIQTNFPNLGHPDLLDAIARLAHVDTASDGDIIMDYGQIIRSIPLLVEGKIRVYREDEDGHELFLYYLHPGQGCAISFACYDKMSSLRAVAAEDCTMVCVPSQKMEEWMKTYPAWNRFTMSTYNQRFEEILDALNEVAFHKLDERLVDYLHKHSAALDSDELPFTHAQIAQELNTSREVISRMLKKLEVRGEVELGRNRIRLLQA